MHKQDISRDVPDGQSQARDASLGVGEYSQLGKVSGREESQVPQRRANTTGKRGTTKSERWWMQTWWWEGKARRRCGRVFRTPQGAESARHWSGTLFAGMRKEVASSACIAAVPHLQMSELIPHCFVLLHHPHHLHQVPQPLSSSLQVIIMAGRVYMDIGPDGRWRVIERPRKSKRSPAPM